MSKLQSTRFWSQRILGIKEFFEKSNELEGWNLKFVSFILLVKPKCNRDHIYGLN
jgi:ABC-type uncharacterized transport system permease subunit